MTSLSLHLTGVSLNLTAFILDLTAFILRMIRFRLNMNAVSLNLTAVMLRLTPVRLSVTPVSLYRKPAIQRLQPHNLVSRKHSAHQLRTDGLQECPALEPLCRPKDLVQGSRCRYDPVGKEGFPMLYDLSPIIRPEIPVWPGDTPFQCRLTRSLAEGASVNLSSITSTPHLGSHADAPFHTEPRGEGMADMPLDRYLGPCRVVRVPPQPLIEPRHVEGIDLANPGRLLFKSESVRDRRTFPERFSAISPELAALLAEKGVLLVGVDAPSVDPFESKTLDAHHALFRGGIAILEGLVLDGVPEGVYELIALPLRLAGLDASPVRAVLRTLER